MLRIITDNTFASRRSIVVEDAEGFRYSFSGPSTKGYPGPTFLVFGGSNEEPRISGDVRIDSPERFGPDFGPEWIRAFMGAFDKR
jgi:hypothetical protein